MDASPSAAMSAARGEPRERAVTCPTCGGSAPGPENPNRPFCSLTCRLVDLGVWLDEGYRVPTDEPGDVP
jgi:uncharacterized protein